MFDILPPMLEQQVFNPPLAGMENPLALAIMNTMQQRGSKPHGLWHVINSLAKASQPNSRTRRRSLRIRLWGALSELLKAELLFRQGASISTSRFPTVTKSKSQHRRTSHQNQEEGRLSLTGRELTSELGGSKQFGTGVHIVENGDQVVQNQLLAEAQPSFPTNPEVKTAGPTMAQISAAASALARRPRKPKRAWTGLLHGERLKRGSLVRVPTGDVLPVYVALRGRVYVLLPDEPRYHGKVFERYRTTQVRRIKSPEAQVLGRLKAGVNEHPSALKAATAHRNGRQPTRPGRRRGRPPGRLMIDASAKPHTTPSVRC